MLNNLKTRELLLPGFLFASTIPPRKQLNRTGLGHSFRLGDTGWVSSGS
jgi:hypothetical protein